MEMEARIRRRPHFIVDCAFPSPTPRVASQDIFEDALENINCSIDDYQQLDAAVAPDPRSMPKYMPLF